jgi:hypothetical protein
MFVQNIGDEKCNFFWSIIPKNKLAPKSKFKNKRIIQQQNAELENIL